MNSEWTAFLVEKGAKIDPADNESISFVNAATNESLFPLSYLRAFIVSGEDAAIFLQGQLTCNINEVTEHQASLAAFCNAKGRVISTLLICKQAEEFIIIVPRTLLQTVIRKLKMYILRAKVNIDDAGDQRCIIGLATDRAKLGDQQLPTEPFAAYGSNCSSTVKLPGKAKRYLLMPTCTEAKQLWIDHICNDNLLPGNTADWRFLDISSGFPWFDDTMTEEYIPQMLNIDKLGGISFNKGCYTGQEIVARTHFLGKAKRELFLAECNKDANIDPETLIINAINGDNVGKILAFRHNATTVRLLLVLPFDCTQDQLVLNTPGHDKINLIPFQ